MNADNSVVPWLRSVDKARPPPMRTQTAVMASVARMEDFHFTIDQVLAGAKSEIAPLAKILRALRYSALLRTSDNTLVPLEALRDGLRASVDLPPDPTAAGDVREPSVHSTIFDPQGEAFASLQLVGEIDESAALLKLLHALLDSAALAITERWFRMQHRNHWIVAAQRRHGPEASLMLAVDCQQRLVGADCTARNILQRKGCPLESRPALSVLFPVGAAVFSDHCDHDLSLNVPGTDDQALYSVLITPPHPGAIQSDRDERLLLHARPRLEIVTWPGVAVSGDARPRGLPPRLLRRVREFIDCNLDRVLNVEGLAEHAGLSESHFSRSFAHSLGMTPHSYVVRRRVLRAQHLLARSNLSISEIALATGFADQSHFCRRFRELVGLPPGAFRASHR